MKSKNTRGCTQTQKTVKDEREEEKNTTNWRRVQTRSMKPCRRQALSMLAELSHNAKRHDDALIQVFVNNLVTLCVNEWAF